MTRNEFIIDLRKALSHLKKDDQDRTISYYSEMIADRIDSGMSEEDAVNKMGSISQIVRGVEEEISIEEVKKEKPKNKNNHATIFILILLAIPLWVPIFASIFSVLVVAYAMIWVLIAVFIVVEASMAIVGIAGIIGFFTNMTTSIPSAFLILGAGLICGGLCLLMFKPMLFIIKKLMYYSKRSFLWCINKTKKFLKEI